MKKIIKLLLALSIVFSVGNVTYASQVKEDDLNRNVYVFVYGHEVSTQKAFIKDERTYIPLRKVAESMDFEVEYNDQTRDITISFHTTKLVMNTKSKDYTINGQKKTMDVTPILLEERTYVPIRFVAEAFETNVDWINDHRLVLVGSYGFTGRLNDVERKYDKVYLKMYLPKNFDDHIKTVYVEKDNKYEFYDKKSGGFLAMMSRHKSTPHSFVIPGYIIDHRDGYFTEVNFASDVQYTKETKDAYNKSLEILKDALGTVLLNY